MYQIVSCLNFFSNINQFAKKLKIIHLLPEKVTRYCFLDYKDIPRIC